MVFEQTAQDQFYYEALEKHYLHRVVSKAVDVGFSFLDPRIQCREGKFFLRNFVE